MKTGITSHRQTTFCKNRFYHLFSSGILQGILFIIISMSDTAIVGYFFGSNGVAAIGVSVPLGAIISFCITFFTGGCRILYPEKIGGYDRDSANEYFSTSMTTAIILTILFAILIVFFGDHFFDIYQFHGDILTMALGYIKYYKYVFVLSPIVTFISQMVFCDGDFRLFTIANTVFFIGNIVFSIIGAKVMGIEGIGLGTLVSGLIYIIIFCFHFFKKENTLKYRFCYSLKKQGEMIRFGFMDSLYPLCLSINGVITSVFIINHIGSKYLAVNSIVGQSMGLMAIFSIATEAMLPLMNVYRGEKNDDGVRKIMGVTGRCILVAGILLTVVNLLAAPLYPAIFSLSDPELSSVCIMGIRMVSLTFVFDGLQTLLTTYFNASGHVVFASVAARCKSTVVYLLCFVAFGALLGVQGLWIGTMLSPLFSFVVVMAIVLMSSKKDGSLKLPKEDPHIKSWDLVLDTDSIMNVRDAAAKYLSEQSVQDTVIKKVEFLVEEALMATYDHNDSKRKIFAEITIICRKDIEVIIRDNGVIYDISDEDVKPASFRDYILTRYYDVIDKKNSGMAVAFNRTRFVFDKASR